MTHASPLALAVGDPAGVGPHIAIEAVCRMQQPVVLFGDGDWLGKALSARGQARVTARLAVSEPLPPGAQFGVCHVASWAPAVLGAGRPLAEAGAAQIAALESAFDYVRGGRARALVTGPVSKEAAALSGKDFTGQTEHLARHARQAADSVTMMFLGPRLRVALVTTHLPLRAVSDAVTEARVARTIVHLAEALFRLGGGRTEGVRLAVGGLNPHAGENGLLGDEEARILEPAIAACAQHALFRDGRARCVGPLPAETALRQAAEGGFDGVVAMAHDQATIASKLLDWERAVNVTWGLPVVRTSVDHGVAYDAVREGRWRAEGLIAALSMASRLT